MKPIQKEIWAEDLMSSALDAAAPWLGASSPNPTVGAAAFDVQGRLLASAAHTKAGQSHAEATVLKICRQNGSFDYIDSLAVTLEPCNHHGRTPPCTNDILTSPAKTIYIGVSDPNPMAAGGAEILRQAGRKVIAGFAERAAWHQLSDFLVTQKTSLPLVVIKIVLDEKGSMIPPPGQKTFTSLKSLTLAHRLRKRTDAILTGAGSVLADHPLFTVRHVADFQEKKRSLVILDQDNQIDRQTIQGYQEKAFDTFISQSLDSALAALMSRGCRSVLVETGPRLTKTIFEQDLWDVAVIIKRRPDGTEDIFTGLNRQKPLLKHLNPFSLMEFLAYESGQQYEFCATSLSDPADSLRQLSDIYF